MSTDETPTESWYSQLDEAEREDLVARVVGELEDQDGASLPRRDLLKGLGVAGAGLAIGGGAVASNAVDADDIVGTAAAGSNAKGQVGTASAPVDVFAEDIGGYNGAPVSFTDGLSSTSVDTDELFTAGRSPAIAVYQRSGTTYAIDKNGVVDSGSSPQPVIQSALSNVGAHEMVRCLGTISYGTSIDLLGKCTFQFDKLDFTGTGYALEHGNKGTSNIFHQKIIGNALHTADSGVDLDSVQQSRVSLVQLYGPDTTGTVGIHTGNPGSAQPSWWNDIRVTMIDRFNEGIRAESAAHRCRYTVGRIHRSGVYGANFTGGTSYINLLDVTGADTSNVRLDAEVQGRAIVETSRGDSFEITDNAVGWAELRSLSTGGLHYNAGANHRLIFKKNGLGSMVFPLRSSAPNQAQKGEAYLDDGTNTASANVAWRVYDGTAWVDQN